MDACSAHRREASGGARAASVMRIKDAQFAAKRSTVTLEQACIRADDRPDTAGERACDAKMPQQIASTQCLFSGGCPEAGRHACGVVAWAGATVPPSCSVDDGSARRRSGRAEAPSRSYFGW
eukprot:6197303-Pleurochrysis_carterae.AAC.4